jgi:shikimate dehydrogenase
MSAPARLAIIGWPVSHSRSPLIHNYWLNAHGINARYETYGIEPHGIEKTDNPKDDFRAALIAMADEGFIGANVTVPHKEAAFAAMDEVSATAQALGAVNTICFQDGRLRGDNTDGDGFVAGLGTLAKNTDWQNRPALVLGAGGAARAIIVALGRAHVPEIRLVNRTRAKAENLKGALAAAQGDRPVRTADWEARDEMAQGCGLLVNTTSLGMVGQPPLDMPLNGLAAQALVCDIVYAPLQTPLLRAAASAGHYAVDGLGMLLHQAALSFEVWFGIKPAIDEGLRALVLADLEEA